MACATLGGWGRNCVPNWNDVLNEITTEIQTHRIAAQVALDAVRRKYLKELYAHNRRNIIAYYSGFLSKPGIAGVDITDEDKNGFMMAIHGMVKRNGLDLILHTPGGSIAAAESIVDYLKRMFGRNIRAIVPQIAMSAGTMIACSCNKIIMGKHSNLGPIDPQLNGIPAAGVIEEFQTALQEIKKDPDAMQVWQYILRQYPPSGQCENGVKWASAFVGTELRSNMFAGRADAVALADNIVATLTDFSGNKSHDRHIHYDECRDMGLEVELLEDDNTRQDLVLTVHHCYMNALMNTAAFKIIENHNGVAFVKQQVQVAGGGYT
jgi:metal-sulfur cluster biosynthetic enzyme